MIFIGIDPGVSGGIAAIDEIGIPIYTGKLATMTERDVIDALERCAGHTSMARIHAVLERVSASPQMGVVSAFTFGKGYGTLKTALTAARIPFDEVPPATWQKAMSCRTGGDKNISKRRAQQLFPSLTITHAIADALLMAEYCRRIERTRHYGEEEKGRGAEDAPAIQREQGQEERSAEAAGNREARSKEAVPPQGRGGARRTAPAADARRDAARP